MASNNVDTIASAGPTKNMQTTLITIPGTPPTNLALYNLNPGPTSPNSIRSS